MRRPLLGIIVVFCLQMGFIAYTAINRPTETFLRVNEIASETNPIAEALDIPDGTEVFNDKDSSGVNRKRIVTETLISSRKVVRAPASRPIYRVPQLVASQKPMKTRLKTEYPQPTPFTTESKNYPLSGRVVSRPEKKSFLSKSIAVFKNPYDWVKALGARIR